jgi:hypothetical protein
VRSLFRHLQILLRVESAIVDMRLRTGIARSTLYAFAALLAAFALGMFNVASFFGLQPLYGPMWAALATALGDIVIAFIIVVIASRAGSRSQMNAAIELRRAAIEGIEAELGTVEQAFGWITRARRDPVDAALTAVLVPFIAAIVRGLRKNKQES